MIECLLKGRKEGVIWRGRENINLYRLIITTWEEQIEKKKKNFRSRIETEKFSKT